MSWVSIRQVTGTTKIGDDGRFLMPMKPKSAQFRPTWSPRAQPDKGPPSASPESHCRGASIPGAHRHPGPSQYGVPGAPRPELGMVSPEPLGTLLNTMAVTISYGATDLSAGAGTAKPAQTEMATAFASAL